MIKQLILLLLVIFPSTFLCAQDTINQTDKEGHKQGHWIGKYTNGSIHYEGSFTDDKPVGEWKRFHQNGKIKAQMHFFPNTDKALAELFDSKGIRYAKGSVSYTHLRAHETRHDLVC